MDASKYLAEFAAHLVDAGLTVEKIALAYLEYNPLDWRVDALILPDWMPPFPRHDTKPIVAVKYRAEFLRYSKGPNQGFLWDGYPDDMMSVGLAFKALIEAPPPPMLWMRIAHHSKQEETADRAVK